MEYINTERLKEEIKKFSATEYNNGTIADVIVNDALNYVLEEIIPSLHEELPDVDLENEVEAYYHENLGFIIGPNDTKVIVESIARYFYDLGLNARKK